MSESNTSPNEAEESNIIKFAYTRRACLAVLRQRLTYNECFCFSEAYAVPYSMREIGQVWCHDLDLSTSNVINIGQTLDCVDRIANLTDEEVIKKVGSPQPGDGVPDCPLRCNRKVHTIHSSLRTTVVQSLDPKSLIPYFEMTELKGLTGGNDRYVSQDQPHISPQDLIFLDIHPVSEMVNQIIESQGYNMVRFLSDLGGISGLYVGITIYTLAELVDLATQMLGIYLPYALSRTELTMARQRQSAARLARRITGADEIFQLQMADVSFIDAEEEDDHGETKVEGD